MCTIVDAQKRAGKVMRNLAFFCPLKKECPESWCKHEHRAENVTRKPSGCYHDPGANALLLAALHFRDLARLEFSYGNFEEGLFLAQLARDLEKIADGQPLRSTATWRALEVQFPSLFSGEINQRLAVAIQEGENDSREAA
jgi:hypothetical protein